MGFKLGSLLGLYSSLAQKVLLRSLCPYRSATPTHSRANSGAVPPCDEQILCGFRLERRRCAPNSKRMTTFDRWFCPIAIPRPNPVERGAISRAPSLRLDTIQCSMTTGPCSRIVVETSPWGANFDCGSQVFCDVTTLEPDGQAAGCNPVEVGSTPTSVSLQASGWSRRARGALAPS